MKKMLTMTLVLVASLSLAVGAYAQSYTVSLSGANENPSNPSPATGSGTFTLDGAKMLSFNISYSGLTAAETAAHIHGPAPTTANAGVQFPLPAGNPKVGTVGPLSPVQEADLNSGLYYVNIHSQAYPGGEIRGQIMADAVANEATSWSRVKALY